MNSLVLSDAQRAGVTDPVNPVSAGIRNGVERPIGLPQMLVAGGLNFGGPAPYPQGRIDMKARQVEANLNLSLNPCVVSGDQVLLVQVLVNLAMNAMDAIADTPPGRRRVVIGTRVRAAEVEISVRDDGIGLPADISGTQFAPFITTKPYGLGIGLTITQTIVEAHGGTIDAFNNPDGGATFTVTLRRSETPSSAVRAPS